MGHHRRHEVPLVTVPDITAVDTNTVKLTASGVGNHTLQAAVKVSSATGNRLGITATGLLVSAATHTLGISAGNLTSTVDGIAATVALPVAPAETPNAKTDTATVAVTLSGTANRTIQAAVKLDATAGQQNLVVATAAGLRVPPTQKARIVTATGNITPADTVIIADNAATNINLSLVGTFDANHVFRLSRAAGSTGSITIQGAGFTFQALNGAVGASTTLPAHSAAGLGVRNVFVLVGTIWYRTG